MNAPSPLAQRLFSLPGFAVLLAGALFACFPEVLLGRESFFFRDYGVLGYPFVHFHRACFWSGELPMWNPYSNCGQPFFAQWGTMSTYPLSLIYLLLPLPFSLSLFCFVHLWIGGIGMYLLARRWSGNDFAGAVAGFAFVFSGVVFASFIWPNYYVALAWMPFVVSFAERAWREGGRIIAPAALVSALQLGSGVPEIIIFTWLIAGVLWLLDLIELPSNGGKMLFRAVSVVLLAAGVMAVQLLPFFDLLVHSQRDTGFATGKWSLPLWGWQNFLLPIVNCFEVDGRYFQYGQEFLSSVYLGAPAITLALVALIKYPTARTFALAGLAMVSVLLAFGDNTPVFPLVRKVIPVLGIARYPVKFLFIAAFILPLLAAQAVRAVQVEGVKGSRALPYVTIVVLLGMGAILWAAHTRQFIDYSTWPENFRVNTWMSWKDAAWNSAWRAGGLILAIAAIIGSARPGKTAALSGVLALAVLAIDARIHTPQQNPTLPAAEMRGVAWNPAVGEKPAHGQGRVFITPEVDKALLRRGGTNVVENWHLKRGAEWSNLNVLDEVPKVNGSSTLQARAQKQFESALYAETNVPPALLDFLDVRFITRRGSALLWEPRTNAMPMVTAGQQPVLLEANEILPALLRPDFDPRAIVLLERAAATGGPTNAARISITAQRITRERMEIGFNADAAGYVVIAQTHFPAWRATIDGRETPVLRANHAFQGIPVPQGQHTLVLTYADRYLRAGIGATGAALLCCLLIWMRSTRLAKE